MDTYTRNGRVEKLAIFEPGKGTRTIDGASPELVNTIALQLKGVERLDLEAFENCKPDKKVLWLCTVYMPPWDLEELQVAAFVLNYPICDDEIEDRFWNFGGVARNCLELNPNDIPNAVAELTTPIEQISDRRPYF
ncbi:hypothetical protein ON010_g1824 [Phytophthora cinnamomi]|nr:hypothetical protein ON010_g1824 [Phytophthora cinnamomi]